VVGGVGVEPPFNDPRRKAQGLAACRHLQGLEVEPLQSLAP